MTTDLLHEFLTLAKNKSFSDTSELLYLSSSTLSRHIASMESELGIELFSRSSRNVSLTSAGSLFLPHAEAIMTLVSSCKEALSRESELDRVPLNIGCETGLIRAVMPHILLDFLHQNGHFYINICEECPEQLQKGLQSGTYDIIFSYKSTMSDYSDVECTNYRQDSLVAAIPPGHRLSSCSQVSLSDLRGEHFLFAAPGTLANRLSLSACNEAGFFPNIILTCSSSDSLCELAAGGLGIALIMSSSIPQNTPCQILEIAEEISEDIMLISNTHKNQSFGTQLFRRDFNRG